MKRPSTQTLLKVTLLTVLAVNLKVPQMTQVTKLSSETAPARGARAPLPIDLGEQGDVAAEGPDASASISLTEDNLWPVCDANYNFRFSEFKEGSTLKVRLVATLLTEEGRDTHTKYTRIYRETFKNIENNENAKIELRDELADRIAERVCPDGTGTRNQATGTAAERQARRSESAPSRTGINTCLVKPNRQKMNEEEQMDCNRGIIEKLDDLDSESTRPEKSGALKKFQEATQRMIKIIKKGLQSTEDDTIDDATTQANDLITSIEGMVTPVIKPEARTKLVNEIRAMLVGADTRRKTLALREKTNDLNDQFKDAFKAYQQRDQEVRQLQNVSDIDKRRLMQNSTQTNDLMNLYRTHNQLTTGIDQTMSQNLTNLRNLQVQGLMTQGDMNGWLSPYQSMQKSLVQMVNPSLMGAGGVMYVPQDPFYAASANSILAGQGSNSISAALYLQNSQLGGNPLGLNSQQMSMYGLGTGSLIGQQQQVGIGQGYNQNYLNGPQRVNTIGIGQGYNTGYNNGFNNVNMGNGALTGSTFGTSFNGNGGSQQLGVGALGAPTGGPTNLGGNSFGNSSMMFRQNGLAR